MIVDGRKSTHGLASGGLAGLRRKFAWRVVVLVLVAGSMGCEPRPPRELAAPRIDTRAAFPELRASVEAGKSEAGSKSAFERSIEQALEGVNAAEQPAAMMLQTVSLGAGLVGDIPVQFDEWRWGSDGKVTLITHGATGQQPGVLIYIEPFGALMATAPSREMVRFQQNVGIGGMMNRALALRDAASSPTLGQGIGFQATPHSFSGWRWVGKNDGDVMLRLGRSAGVWGPQPSAPAGLLGMLEQFSDSSPELAQLQAYLGNLQQENGRADRARVVPRTATMILANAASSPTTGIHLAIVCQHSVCGQASELAHFLASIRPAGPDSGVDAAQISPPTDTLEAMSAYVGLVLVPESVRVSPARFEDILRKGPGGLEIPGLNLEF